MRGIRFVLLAMSALPSLLAGCARGPSDVVERFTRAVGSGDTGAALAELDPELRQVGGMKLVAALNQAAEKARAHGGLRRVEITRETSTGDLGSATVREFFGDGTSATDTEKVRRVGGRWYVTV